MRIGIDFDNTIVSYDALFHRVALEKSLIPADVPQSKLAVRDFLRGVNNEDAWTEMQGYVYGSRMDEAEAYPGAIDFIRRARDAGIDLAIVSHKTKHPFLGPQYDLHAAARGWVEKFLKEGGVDLIAPGDVYFEITKNDKIKRIETIGCDYFIDDLPEILLAPAFPRATKRILFAPDGGQAIDGMSAKVESWGELAKLFEEKWKSN